MLVYGKDRVDILLLIRPNIGYTVRVKQFLILFLEKYLVFLSKYVLNIYQPIIIGITGSVGKTTCKEVIAHILRANNLHYRKTEGNLNTDLGIALTILGFDQSPAFWEWPIVFIWLHLNWMLLILRIRRFPAFFVVELGIDQIGDMERMLRFIKPKIGIVTWIGEGHHLEQLKDPQTIAQEKGKLLTVLPEDGLAIIPAHDSQFKLLVKLATAPTVDIKSVGTASFIEIAQAVGNYLKLDSLKVKTALDNLPVIKGRLNVFPGINGSTVLDDSYNSSLPSVKLALETLANHRAKRKIAILGDILEQGMQEEKVHNQLAQLAKAKADLLIGVGKRMQKVKTDLWFPSPGEAIASIVKEVKSGDLVLVKGSQGMRMEKISLALAADPAFAEKFLPRQTTRWRQIEFKNP